MPSTNHKKILKYNILYFYKMRSQKAIDLQYKKYLELRGTVNDESDWIRDYGYYLIKNLQDSNQWFGLLIGPTDSLYTGSLLLVKIFFPEDFPFSPPQIKNLLPFSTKFNENLWSVDTVQSLMCSDNIYREFYGLICMDILNTPHVTVNDFGVEVYDKTKEQYSPIMTVNNIMMSMRSNILNGETRLPHIDDLKLKYLLLRFLAYGVLDGTYVLTEDERDYIQIEWGSVLSNIFKIHQSYYKQIINQLNDSKEYDHQIEELDKLDLKFEKKYG